jgi:hypothetical protein
MVNFRHLEILGSLNDSYPRWNHLSHLILHCQRYLVRLIYLSFETFLSFSGFIMSRLWGMITSIQLIVLMPLISVDFPANVQLVYVFFSDYLNF